MRSLTSKDHSFRLALWLGGLIFVAVGVFAIRAISSVNHAAQGQSQRTFVLDVDFTRFRKIMVRRNATKSIVEHGGMKMIEQRMQGITLDVSTDERPVLNTLLGRANADVTAQQQIIVELTDSTLEADRVSMTQTAQIDPDMLNVATEANQPTGNLQEYESRLRAVPYGSQTEVTIEVDFTVRVDIPSIFVGRADAKVQAAAEQAMQTQEMAIRDLIEQQADEFIILPERR